MSLWAVTSYFNPRGYERRRANFSVFRDRLEAPLIAVELGFDGRFDLTPDDAEVLVQIDEGDTLWQKERLLNIGLGYLPDDCDAVLLIDCDVFFQSLRWHQRLLRLLERYPVVQAFTTVQHLDADWTSGADPGAHLMLEQLGLAASPDPVAALSSVVRRTPDVPASGYVWAYRRDSIPDDGLFDSCIIGGGDSALAAAIYGVQQAVVRLHYMTPGQESRYRSWAGSLTETVQGRVGALDGVIASLWHGKIADRQPRQRHRILVEHDFHPDRDIRIGAAGAWVWSSEKPQLHEDVARYFADRLEDG